MLAVDPAWPVEDPGRFALAVFAGGSVALLLFHVVPAMSAGRVERLFAGRAGAAARWLLGVWVSAGAAASLWQLGRGAASMWVLYRDGAWLGQPIWKGAAIAIAAVWVCGALLIAWERLPGAAWMAALTLGAGISLALGSLWVQSPGLLTRNGFLSGEEGLGRPFRVAQGMLAAAAPASILALRIGRMGLSRRKIWWSGFLGMWVPLAVSAVTVSLAKVAGVRLYWKPSLAIDWYFAFLWPLQTADSAAALLFPLGLTLCAPSVVCAVWIRELAPGRGRGLQRLMAIAGIAAVGYLLAQPDCVPYSRYWLGSIACAAVAGFIVRPHVLLTLR